MKAPAPGVREISHLETGVRRGGGENEEGGGGTRNRGGGARNGGRGARARRCEDGATAGARAERA